jgi:hypothetical protein
MTKLRSKWLKVVKITQWGSLDSEIKQGPVRKAKRAMSHSLIIYLLEDYKKQQMARRTAWKKKLESKRTMK